MAAGYVPSQVWWSISASEDKTALTLRLYRDPARPPVWIVKFADGYEEEGGWWYLYQDALPQVSTWENDQDLVRIRNAFACMLLHDRAVSGTPTLSDEDWGALQDFVWSRTQIRRTLELLGWEPCSRSSVPYRVRQANLAATHKQLPSASTPRKRSSKKHRPATGPQTRYTTDQALAVTFGLLQGFNRTHLPELAKQIGYGGLRRFLPTTRKAFNEVFLAAAWATLRGCMDTLGSADGHVIATKFYAETERLMGQEAARTLGERVMEYDTILSGGGDVGDPEGLARTLVRHLEGQTPTASQIMLQLGRAIARHVGVGHDPIHMMTLISYIAPTMQAAREAFAKLAAGEEIR